MRKSRGCWIILIGGLGAMLAAPPAAQDGQANSRAADLDNDGIPDQLEQDLAERYAPLLLMDPNEPNLPMEVHRFLAAAELWTYDESCTPLRKLVATPFLNLSTAGKFDSCKDFPVTPQGTRSFEKKHTFYLHPSDAAIRRGSTSTTEWTTYFHAYRNDLHGITIQYWRFYAYNTGYLWGIEIPWASHEGDWEAIHVVLGSTPFSSPVLIRLLGHQKIESHFWRDVVTAGEHAIIRVERGGHTSVLANRQDAAHRSAFLQHESWSGGRVVWPSGRRGAEETVSRGGPLRNLGEKTAPLKDMEFLLYTGLWGSREAGLLGYYRSGYWGPALNETSMRRDGFITAWCEGMADPAKEVRNAGIGLVRECFASQSVP